MPTPAQAKWAYQINPHDLWDYDEINENVLLDLPIDGKRARCSFNRPQRLHVCHRPRRPARCCRPSLTTLSTPIKDIDLKTGRPVLERRRSTRPRQDHPRHLPRLARRERLAADRLVAAHKAALRAAPASCMNYKTSQVGYIAGTPFVGATVDMYAGPGGYRGEFMAWDVANKKKAWSIAENFPVWSGTLVTAGDVAFYGTMDRWFKAVDAKSGKLLWKFHAGSGIIGQPVTYQGSDGRQYIAILSGVGGWSGAIANAEIDPRVRNGALGFNGATQDLPAYTKGGSELLVFAIPKRAAVQAEAAP